MVPEERTKSLGVSHGGRGLLGMRKASFMGRGHDLPSPGRKRGLVGFGRWSQMKDPPVPPEDGVCASQWAS